jgi:hypothetical protein
MIDKDPKTYQTTLTVVRRYYGDNTPMSEEYELFKVIQNTRGVSENYARKILGEVQRQASHQDYRALDIKKSNLIKEVNHSFGQNFWDVHRVPDYRLLATIQMVIDASRSVRPLTESVQNIQLEEGLVGYMATNGEFSHPPPPREEIDNLVMALTAKKFQEKYSKSLNKNQQVLLEKYIRFQVSGDEAKFKEFLRARKSNMTAALNKSFQTSDIQSDKLMKEKMTEAINKFNNLNFGTSDDFVSEMMLFENLIEEVENE